MATAARAALFDTNLFIQVFLAGSREAVRCRRYLLDTFEEVRCAVVLHELMRGDRETGYERRLRRLNGTRRRRTEPRNPRDYEVPGVQLEPPTLDDWKAAGRALQELRTADVVRLRKMTNDALIASLCLRKNLLLISADGDFAELKNTRTLAALSYVPWDVLRQRILE